VSAFHRPSRFNWFVAKFSRSLTAVNVAVGVWATPAGGGAAAAAAAAAAAGLVVAVTAQVTRSTLHHCTTTVRRGLTKSRDLLLKLKQTNTIKYSAGPQQI